VTRRRLLLICASVTAGVVVLAALVAIGRWEQRRAVSHQATGMRTILAAIGGRIAVNSISGYRYGPPNCLSYAAGKDLFGLQLCFSADGHLVTAVDRRGQNPVYYSLEYRPSLSPIVFPPQEIRQLLREAQAASR
jgi:hypothetical protein